MTGEQPRSCWSGYLQWRGGRKPRCRGSMTDGLRMERRVSSCGRRLAGGVLVAVATEVLAEVSGNPRPKMDAVKENAGERKKRSWLQNM